MAFFTTSRLIPSSATDFTSVVSDVLEHFRAQGYETASNQLLDGSSHISISKGNMFKAVLGLKTALNIDIQPSSVGILVTAGVGIFGRQAIPTIISLFFFWPVKITQIWGVVKQANLDDEAVTLIEQRLAAHAENSSTATLAPPSKPGQFCVECGVSLPASSKFCPHCGAKLA